MSFEESALAVAIGALITVVITRLVTPWSAEPPFWVGIGALQAYAVARWQRQHEERKQRSR